MEKSGIALDGHLLCVTIHSAVLLYVAPSNPTKACQTRLLQLAGREGAKKKKKKEVSSQTL